MREWIKITILIIGVISIVAIVEYFVLRQKKAKSEITLFGNVDVRLVDVGFRVPGRVAAVYFEEGDLVKTGDLLSSLDKSPYDAELKEAVSALEAIEASLHNAEILLKRRQELIGVGGVSQEDLDNAMATFETQYANWMQAKAAVQVAIDNLAYTESYAPTNGVILTRVREPGTVVNPADPVLTISVASPVWIRAFANEPDLGNIYYGQTALIYTDTKGVMPFKGQVGFISPMAEFTPKTVETLELRTDLVYRLRVYAENPDWRLKQGMPVTVKLKIDHHEHPD